MRYISTADAICNLRPGAKFEMLFDKYENLNWLSPEIAIPTKEEVEAEIVRIREEREAQKYIFVRQANYPTLPEQLDILYHEGYDGWKAVIAAVKEKYPKP